MEILQNPIMQSVLAAVIFLSILTEVKTAGFSGGGLIALLGGVLLLLGAGETWPMTESLLYFGGLSLILLDLCVLFTGFVTVVGLLAVMTALFLLFGSGMGATVVLIVGVVLAILMLIFLDKKLPDNPVWRKISLSLSLSSQEGYLSSAEDLSPYEGKQGIAKTVLRPAGKVEIEGKVLDAVTQGDFIRPGESVVVIKAESNRVVVGNKTELRIEGHD